MAELKEVIKRGPIINSGNSALSIRIREAVKDAEKLAKYDPAKDPVIREHKRRIDKFFGINSF